MVCPPKLTLTAPRPSVLRSIRTFTRWLKLQQNLTNRRTCKNSVNRPKLCTISFLMLWDRLGRSTTNGKHIQDLLERTCGSSTETICQTESFSRSWRHYRCLLKRTQKVSGIL